MSYKLTYFDIPGKAEPIRLLLSLAKVKFEDHRIARTKWPALKLKMPWGQLPVLYVDGKEIAQSVTILRFIARKHNLAGVDEWEAARCDEIGDALTELAQERGKYLHCSDPDKKQELKEAFHNVHMPKYLGKLESLQKENGGCFLVGKSRTWIDVVLAWRLKALGEEVDQSVISQYPHLVAVKEAVFAISEIKDYMDLHK